MAEKGDRLGAGGEGSLAGEVMVLANPFPRGQDPRVEQQAGAVGLDQHAGVTQVRQSHRQTPIFVGDLVKYTLTLRE